MEWTGTKRLVIASLFLALGILLPYFTAHMFALPGTVLLPMHIPVLLAGLICGPKIGFVVGMFTPVLSTALTGMPPFFPMLPIMFGELATYGFIGGLVFKKTNKIYPSVIIAMLCGRITYGIIFTTLILTNEGPIQALGVMAAVTMGLPGILIQLTVIPIIVKAILKLRSGGDNG